MLVYNHPEKIKIIDSLYFVSMQSGFDYYMTNVLLSRIENHIFVLEILMERRSIISHFRTRDNSLLIRSRDVEMSNESE